MKIFKYNMSQEQMDKIQRLKDQGFKVKLKIKVRTSCKNIKVSLQRPENKIVKAWEGAPALMHCVLQTFVEVRRKLMQNCLDNLQIKFEEYKFYKDAIDIARESYHEVQFPKTSRGLYLKLKGGLVGGAYGERKLFDLYGEYDDDFNDAYKIALVVLHGFRNEGFDKKYILKHGDLDNYKKCYRIIKSMI